MMKAEEDGEYDAPELTEQRKREIQRLSEKQESNNQLENQHARPSRRLSDAEQRNEDENQRYITHKEKMRRSVANNRFLRQEISTKPVDRKQEEEEEENPAVDSDDEHEDLPTEELLPAPLVVPSRKKSAAAAVSAADSAGNSTLNYPQNYLITPIMHFFPVQTLQNSRWTQELDEEAACGLFVNDKRQQFKKIEPSTLIRAEERLQREYEDFQIIDILHSQSVRTETNQALEVEEREENERNVNTVDHRGHASLSTLPSHSTPSAVLEIYVDRVILDDHVSFSLAERIEAQLQSLYATYGQMQQLQPWQLYLDRIDTYITLTCTNNNNDQKASTLWKSQTLQDVEKALNELYRLQQLHKQLIIKWNELRDCRRRDNNGNADNVTIRMLQRAEPIKLIYLQAFLELVRTQRQSAAPEEATQVDLEHLANQLEELQVDDKCMSVVLVREINTTKGESSGVPPSASSSRLCGLSMSSKFFQKNNPRFYVVVFVNGKPACTTKTCSWNKSRSCTAHRSQLGVIHFKETLQFKLPYFPDSVSIKIYEKGLLLDAIISTSLIPIMIPGDSIFTSSTGEWTARPISSLSPSDEWYQFSSTTPIARSKWHESFLQSSLYTTATRHPHGRIHIRASWVLPLSNNNEQSTHVMCMVPPRRPALMKLQQQLHSAKLIGNQRCTAAITKTREEQSRSGFWYERDFLVQMDGLDQVLDPNDPDNAPALRLQAYLREKSTPLAQRDIFRTSSLAFIRPDGQLGRGVSDSTSNRLFLTKRNQLLQMRDREHVAKFGTSICEASASRGAERRNSAVGTRIDGSCESNQRWRHAIFDEPMALNESEIIRNEQYLSLLRPEVAAFDHRLQVQMAEDAGDAFSIERRRQMNLLKIRDFVERVKSSSVFLAKRQVMGKEKVKSLASIIQEQPLPLFPGAVDLSGLDQLFSRRRRLRPQTVKRSAPTAVAEWPTYCEIYVQIQRVANVPIRVANMGSSSSEEASSRNKKKPNPKAGRHNEHNDDDDETPRTDNDESEIPMGAAEAELESHVFVEVCFQGKRRKTSSACISSTNGTTGVWMETLVLPFRPPMDEWSPDSIQRCQDNIRINLFDRVIVQGENDDEPDISEGIAATDGTGMRAFHHENVFLGGLEIPFTTLYQSNGLLEATLRCEMPVEHLGYRNLRETVNALEDGLPSKGNHEANPNNIESTDKDDDAVRRACREGTFLSFMMTLDPLLPQPIKAFDDAVAPIMTQPSDATTKFFQYAKQWIVTTQQMNMFSKARDFQVFVRNLYHGKTFMTQYLCAQQPPRSAIFSTSLQQLVRYVKLIPFLDDWHLFDGEKDVWSTSQEFLEINAGDYEEHAVLLCNFLQWFDRNEPTRRNYLVVGHAVPEGKSVYVLRQHAYKIPQRSVLWNASTGVGYGVLDENCPMRDVSLVISNDNIYANIQSVTHVQNLNWEIETNPKAWKPFFSNSTLTKEKCPPLPSVQVRELVYSETPDAYVKQVELEISETLKLEIRRWRSTRFTTTFNLDASLKLRNHLEELERQLQGRPTGKKGATKDIQALEELQRTKEVCGIPLNLTFTDIGKVIDMVKNTNIHWNERPNAEFALAVYVCGYPNCVLSVWIYFVTLFPK